MCTNPDNPKKCPYLMADGIHCLEKTCSDSWKDEPSVGLVKCLFISDEEDVFTGDDELLELEDDLLRKKKVRIVSKYSEKRYIP